MVQISSKFIVLAAASSAMAAGVQKRSTVAQVEADLSAVAVSVTALSSVIAAFPTTGANLFEALSVHGSATAVEAAVSTASVAAAAVTPKPVATADAAKVISQLAALVPAITGALNTIVAKKAVFSSLGVQAIVSGDLATLSSGTHALETALIAAAPAAYTSSASSLASVINAAFATAIAEF